MRVLALAGVALLSAMSVVAAVAQPAPTPPPPTQAPPPPTTYKSLLDQGFEVKNVMLMSGDVSTRLGQAIVSDSVMVTLQKGGATATCWILLTGWQQHAIGGVSCNLLK